jgi:hypothetical protein
MWQASAVLAPRPSGPAPHPTSCLFEATRNQPSSRVLSQPPDPLCAAPACDVGVREPPLGCFVGAASPASVKTPRGRSSGRHRGGIRRRYSRCNNSRGNGGRCPHSAWLLIPLGFVLGRSQYCFQGRCTEARGPRCSPRAAWALWHNLLAGRPSPDGEAHPSGRPCTSKEVRP